MQRVKKRTFQEEKTCIYIYIYVCVCVCMYIGREDSKNVAQCRNTVTSLLEPPQLSDRCIHELFSGDRPGTSPGRKNKEQGRAGQGRELRRPFRVPPASLQPRTGWLYPGCLLPVLVLPRGPILPRHLPSPSLGGVPSLFQAPQPPLAVDDLASRSREDGIPHPWVPCRWFGSSLSISGAC